MTELERKRRALINKHVTRGTVFTAQGTHSVAIEGSAELPLCYLEAVSASAAPEQTPSFTEPYTGFVNKSTVIKIKGKNLCDLDYLFDNVTNAQNGYNSAMIYVGAGNYVTASIDEKWEKGLGFYLVLSTYPAYQGANSSSSWWLYHNTTSALCRKSITFKATQDYIYVTYNNKTNMLKHLTKLQIEISKTATEYEPCFIREVEIPCTLDVFDGSASSLCFDLERGASLMRRAKSIELSNLNWSFGISTMQRDYVFFYTNDAPQPKSKNGFCSHGVWINEHQSSLAEGTVAVGFISGSLTICISTSLIPYTERESGGIYAQVSDLVEFLAENPIYALYALKNEQDIELDKTVYDDICSLIAPYGKSAELSTASPCLVQAKYYSLSKQDESIITVKYLDVDEKEIAPPLEKSVRCGTLCLAEPIHIDGYVPLDGAVKSVARENTVLKIYYKKEKANE